MGDPGVAKQGHESILIPCRTSSSGPPLVVMDRRRAEDELENWGRWLYSDMEEHGISRTGHVMPPTSSGYNSPPYIEGETPEARMPVDEILGQFTNDLVVAIGVHNMDTYRTLVYWYSRIHDQHVWPKTLRRTMARFLRTNLAGAERMLQEGISHYHQLRLKVKP